MGSELLDFIRERSEGRMKAASGPAGLTIGLEHEFFLCNKSGGPTTHEQSQLFLKELSNQPGWRIREKSKDEEHLLRVSRDEDHGRFTAVKYDHHPHLMEVAFGYKADLHELREQVSTGFAILDHAAGKADVRVKHAPFLDISASDPRVTSPLKPFQDLRNYRRRLFQIRGERENAELENYAAIIAATQTHIGGTGWLFKPELISRLYRLEPEAHLYAARGVVSTDKEITSLLARRWYGYRQVFLGYPLIGFPDLEDWTLETWTAALLEMPLSGGPENHWAGYSAKQLGGIPFQSFDDFLTRVRDLQIIRPRIFGTLEFRADAAQPTPDRIVAIAALRLANCIGIMQGHQPSTSFAAARAKWEQSLSLGGALPTRDFLNRAKHWLSLRNLNEETLVEPLYGPEVSSAA